jgi:uncharacterized protein DUF5681
VAVKVTSGAGSNKGDRDGKGRYLPGRSGNPKGRPPKPKRVLNESQLYEDILNAMEEETVIVVDGKRYRVPSIVLVYKQLVRKGAAGDVRCMFKAIDLREQILTQYSARISELAELVARARRTHREKPGDFTDEDLETLRELGQRIRDPYHLNRTHR